MLQLLTYHIRVQRTSIAMTDYVKIERDFIERTLKIIDQYEELVRGRIGPEHEYEVTLLMNCLLGLLIYPQQLADQQQWRGGRWLTKDLVKDVGYEWGLQTDYIRSAGYKHDGTPVSVGELTLRNLVRQMRNAAAHACFKVTEGGVNSGQICEVEFQDTERTDGFHIVIPVISLEQFVRRLAESALKNIPA
jgi:hypothetical protein